MTKLLPAECGSCTTCGDSRSQPLVTGLRKLGVDLGRADYVVALAGNPNTGKSTVFNSLTGLRQHTGNWPGKTVARSEGGFSYADKRYKLVDLPGTYSLLATSYDEEIARDFLLFGRPDVTVIVADATRLERNLNLVLQVLEITDRAVVCLNLVDEARRHRFEIDHHCLSEELGVPVVPTSARYGDGLPGLLEAIHRVATSRETCQPRRVGGRSPALGEAVSQLRERLDATFPGLRNSEWIALRLLDGDEHVGGAVRDGQLRSLCSPQSTGRGTMAALGLSETDEAPREILALASTLRWDVGPNFHQSLVETMYTEAARIADATVRRDGAKSSGELDRKLDRILTSRLLGFPAMVLLLAFVLWLTVAGANVPSKMLSALLLDTIHPALKSLAANLGFPWWLGGLLIDGVYLATAWVVSVMLPPMAIFFPLFTLLEDFGYLPRVAFNLDSIFRRCGAHGKQALTMSMGFGCNAAGVIATRVIDSPRERLIAILTNNFALCNGRWPTQILVAAIFLGALAPPYLAGLISAVAVVSVALLGVVLTFAVSWTLSRTVLRGEASTFSLELPPYRPPRILQTLYTSFIDRTIFVLWRAVVFAIPAGAAIWLVANVQAGGLSLAEHATGFLNPLGLVLGLNGVILLAYIVAIPANEIVIPTILMLTAMTASLAGVGEGAGVMFELESAPATEGVLRAGGWTVLTSVNLMLFSLVHNPCSTTIYTVFKETRSVKWTLVAALLPLALGLLICLAVAQTWRLFAGG